MRKIITLEDIRKVLHLRQAEAAKQLGVSLSVLKKACKDLNLKKWPHRKLQAVTKKRELLNETLTVKSSSLSSHEIQLIKMELVSLTEKENLLRDVTTLTGNNPDAASESSTKSDTASSHNTPQSQNPTDTPLNTSKIKSNSLRGSVGSSAIDDHSGTLTNGTADHPVNYNFNSRRGSVVSLSAHSPRVDRYNDDNAGDSAQNSHVFFSNMRRHSYSEPSTFEERKPTSTIGSYDSNSHFMTPRHPLGHEQFTTSQYGHINVNNNGFSDYSKTLNNFQFPANPVDPRNIPVDNSSTLQPPNTGNNQAIDALINLLCEEKLKQQQQQQQFLMNNRQPENGSNTGSLVQLLLSQITNNSTHQPTQFTHSQGSVYQNTSSQNSSNNDVYSTMSQHQNFLSPQPQSYTPQHSYQSNLHQNNVQTQHQYQYQPPTNGNASGQYLPQVNYQGSISNNLNQGYQIRDTMEKQGTQNLLGSLDLNSKQENESFEIPDIL